MIRTPVYLTDRQLKALGDASAATGRSVTELIRQAVDQYLAGREAKIERAVDAAGRFSSGRSDVSARHDKHLAEAFVQ